MVGHYYSAHVFCCLNERASGHPRGCCKEKDSEALFNYFKLKVKEAGLPDIRVNRAGCLDRCEDGPTVVIYPEGVWYQLRGKHSVDRIVSEHLEQGTVVADFALPNKK